MYAIVDRSIVCELQDECIDSYRLAAVMGCCCLNTYVGVQCNCATAALGQEEDEARAEVLRTVDLYTALSQQSSRGILFSSSVLLMLLAWPILCAVPIAFAA